MNKEKIHINDFDLFNDSIKALSKLVDAAKFMIDDTGLAIFSKNDFARSELTTNAIVSDNKIEFNIGNLKTFSKILDTVKEVHENDFSRLNFFLDMPSIHFESNKFKTKFMTYCDSDLIDKWISQKVQTELKSIFEFTTTSDMIRRLNSHSYIFNNSDELRIYLNIDKTLENNVLYATLGNNTNSLNNSMTLKFGLITYGDLKDRKLILDYNRLNAFNVIQSNDIKIKLMDKYNVLLSEVKVKGKNDTFFNFNMYNSLRKS